MKTRVQFEKRLLCNMKFCKGITEKLHLFSNISTGVNKAMKMYQLLKEKFQPIFVFFNNNLIYFGRWRVSAFLSSCQSVPVGSALS